MKGKSVGTKSTNDVNLILIEGKGEEQVGQETMRDGERDNAM